MNKPGASSNKNVKPAKPPKVQKDKKKHGHKAAVQGKPKQESNEPNPYLIDSKPDSQRPDTSLHSLVQTIENDERQSRLISEPRQAIRQKSLDSIEAVDKLKENFCKLYNYLKEKQTSWKNDIDRLRSMLKSMGSPELSVKKDEREEESLKEVEDEEEGEEKWLKEIEDEEKRERREEKNEKKNKW